MNNSSLFPIFVYKRLVWAEIFKKIKFTILVLCSNILQYFKDTHKGCFLVLRLLPSERLQY